MSFMYTLSSHTHILTYSYTTEYKAFSYLATQTYLLESFLVRHKHLPDKCMSETQAKLESLDKLTVNFIIWAPISENGPYGQKFQKLIFAENCSVTSTAGYKPVKSSLSWIKHLHCGLNCSHAMQSLETPATNFTSISFIGVNLAGATR